MITAHGGALGTIRNSKLYFARVDSYLCDTLEVDIRKKAADFISIMLPDLSRLQVLCRWNTHSKL